MPGPTSIVRGNVSLEMVMLLTLNTPSVGANTSVVQTYTVNGLLPNDFVEINQQSHIVGLTIANCWVSAVNTLSIQFANVTGATIGVQTGVQYIVNVDRIENSSLGSSAFPNQIV
jgi:hypothetical protein